MMDRRLLEKIASELKWGALDRVFIRLSKGDLKSLPQEDFEFIKQYVTSYYRGRHRLNPKSLDHFLSTNKYEDDCEAHFSIPEGALVERGVLRVVEENGVHFWYLGGEKLDPVTYMRLYKSDQRTLRGLLRTLNLESIYDTYKPTIIDGMYDIMSFEYDGLTYFVVLRDRNEVVMRCSKHVYEDAQNHRIVADITVTHPTPDDVKSMSEMMRLVEADVTVKLAKIKEWLGRVLGSYWDRASVNNISGVVVVKNYVLSAQTINLDLSVDIDSNSELDVEVQYRYYPSSFEVTMRNTIGSQYITYAVYSVGLDTHSWTDDGGTYTFDYDINKKRVFLTYQASFSLDPSVDDLPDMSAPLRKVLNLKKAIRDAIKDSLNNILHSTIKVTEKGWYTEEVGTVSDVLSAIKWKDDQTVEESIVKIWLARVLIAERAAIRSFNKIKSVDPDIIATLISLVHLDGVSYDYLLENVNNGFGYLVKLARRGAIKIADDGEVHINGKPTGISLKENLLFKRIFTALDILVSGVEEDRKTQTKVQVA